MALTIPKVWVDGEKLYSNDLNGDIQAIQSYINDYCLVSTDAAVTNTASKIVKRDANGDFAARIITAVGATDTAGFVGDLEGTADKAISLEGGGSSRIPYQSAADTTAFVEAGTSGYVFQSQGAGAAPNWLNMTNNNLVNTGVKRDNSGNFSANTITADLVGDVTGDLTGDVTGNVTGNVTGDVDGKSLTTDALTNSAITSQFKSSFGTGGYQYLPDGLILQWGYSGSQAVGGGYTNTSLITFPIQFPNACYNVVASGRLLVYALNLTVSTFTLSLTNVQDSVVYSETTYWRAIGK